MSKRQYANEIYAVFSSYLPKCLSVKEYPNRNKMEIMQYVGLCVRVCACKCMSAHASVCAHMRVRAFAYAPSRRRVCAFACSVCVCLRARVYAGINVHARLSEKALCETSHF